jgi:drug/metabolite transporter (DMT)-like permease
MENAMELLGTGLGLIAALLWGSADILAALASHRLRTFKTTFLSQTIGLFALLAFGTIAFWRWHLPLTFTELLLSALIGLFTGMCAALGYFAFYRALEIGPMAVVSPITSTSSTFTLVLSVLLLQEQLPLERTDWSLLSCLASCSPRPAWLNYAHC